MKFIRHSASLPKQLSSSKLTPPLESRNLVLDDRFEVQNDSTCINIGFSISALSSLSREDGIWRKGTKKFPCSHLGVDISHDAGQAAAQIDHQYQWDDWLRAMEQEQKGRCIGRIFAESKNPYSNQER